MTHLCLYVNIETINKVIDNYNCDNQYFLQF